MNDISLFAPALGDVIELSRPNNLRLNFNSVTSNVNRSTISDILGGWVPICSRKNNLNVPVFLEKNKTGYLEVNKIVNSQFSAHEKMEAQVRYEELINQHKTGKKNLIEYISAVSDYPHDLTAGISLIPGTLISIDRIFLTENRVGELNYASQKCCVRLLLTHDTQFPTQNIKPGHVSACLKLVISLAQLNTLSGKLWSHDRYYHDLHPKYHTWVHRRMRGKNVIAKLKTNTSSRSFTYPINRFKYERYQDYLANHLNSLEQPEEGQKIETFKTFGKYLVRTGNSFSYEKEKHFSWLWELRESVKFGWSLDPSFSQLKSGHDPIPQLAQRAGKLLIVK